MANAVLVQSFAELFERDFIIAPAMREDSVSAIGCLVLCELNKLQAVSVDEAHSCAMLDR